MLDQNKTKSNPTTGEKVKYQIPPSIHAQSMHPLIQTSLGH
jgi:hypothetical protein